MICIVVMGILAVCPLIAASYSQNPETNSETEKKDIISLARSLCKEDFCDETIKAILVISKNNHSVKKEKTNAEPDKLYYRIEKLFSKTSLSLTYEGETVYIPTATLSKGYIKTDKLYPYIKKVASPWDTYNKNFVYRKEYPCGISLEGINYLCSNGLSYKEALMWYLPNFSIK